MLLVPIPWAGQVWALPFLTGLAPSERYHQQRGQPHNKLTDWARQMLLQVRRWFPKRTLVGVGDSSYATLELLHLCQALAHPMTFITRLRLAAALYAPAPLQRPGQKGRPRRKGVRRPTLQQVLASAATAWTTITVPHWYGEPERVVEILSNTAVWYHTGLPPVPIRWILVRDPRGKFEPQALLCTDLAVAPEQVLAWFVMRWRVEVTFQEARAHLGLETQRQWSDRAIARTTPALLGLFSWVTLAAHLLQETPPILIRSAAWYSQALPTFSDTIALVRQQLWSGPESFQLSASDPDIVKIPRSLLAHLVDTASYAA